MNLIASIFSICLKSTHLGCKHMLQCHPPLYIFPKNPNHNLISNATVLLKLWLVKKNNSLYCYSHTLRIDTATPSILLNKHNMVSHSWLMYTYRHFHTRAHRIARSVFLQKTMNWIGNILSKRSTTFMNDGLTAKPLRTLTNIFVLITSSIVLTFSSTGYVRSFTSASSVIRRAITFQRYCRAGLNAWNIIGMWTESLIEAVARTAILFTINSLIPGNQNKSRNKALINIVRRCKWNGKGEVCSLQGITETWWAAAPKDAGPLLASQVAGRSTWRCVALKHIPTTQYRRLRVRTDTTHGNCGIN